MPRESRPTWATLTGMGRCHTLGKLMYSDKKTAKRMKRVVDRDLRTFRCDHCDTWHNGHAYGLTRAEHREKHEGR